MIRRTHALSTASLLAAGALLLTGCATDIRSASSSDQSASAKAAVASSKPTPSTTTAVTTDEPAPSSTAVRIAPKGIAYTEIEALVQEWETATGSECEPDPEAGDGPMLAHDSASCGPGSLLAIYSSEGDRDAQIGMARQALAEFDMYTEWVMGENWTITSDEDNLTELAVLIGGDVIGLGNVEAAD